MSPKIRVVITKNYKKNKREIMDKGCQRKNGKKIKPYQRNLDSHLWLHWNLVFPSPFPLKLVTIQNPKQHRKTKSKHNISFAKNRIKSKEIEGLLQHTIM